MMPSSGAPAEVAIEGGQGHGQLLHLGLLVVGALGQAVQIHALAVVLLHSRPCISLQIGVGGWQESAASTASHELACKYQVQ